MRHLIIKNVGPIKNVDIELKRFNILIGAQSSGKSTIAKILSTCSWVEKEIATTQNPNAVQDAASFKSLVENFHKMVGYFNDDSEIYYETDAIKIHYLPTNLQVNLKDDVIYKRKKVCYIPSERNIVTLPELQGYEFKATNLRSFLFDWLAAREYYGPANKSENILDLGVRYFFNANEPFEKDRIEHSNGVTYGISLPNASSGLQSVVPLFIMLQYYSGQYFKDYDKKVSFVGEENKKKLMLSLVGKYIVSRMPTEEETDSQAFVKKCLKEANGGNEEYAKWILEFSKVFESLIIPQNTDFIVEEPEQNLFPSTQKSLVENLVSTCNENGREHGFTLTTHSPYVLSALNNLIYAYQVGQKKDVSDIVPKQCWIAPSDVCAWMVMDNGTVEDIIDPELRHIMAEKIDSVSTCINEAFESLMKMDLYGATE